MNRIAKVLSQISDDMLMHYGVARRSGRYPWGSGDNPYQHSGDFLSRVQSLKKSGMSETDIAKTMGLTTTQLRTQMSLAKDERRAVQVATAKDLREKGYSLNEIADKMGFANDSSVRSLLNENSEARMNQAKAKHHGIKGMRWGVRRYQSKDGSLTSAGRKRQSDGSGEKQATSSNTKKKIAVAAVSTATIAAAAYYVHKNPEKIGQAMSKFKGVKMKDLSQKAADKGREYVKNAVKGAKDGVEEATKEAPKKAAKAVVAGIIMNQTKKALDSAVGKEESAKIFQANDNKKIGKFWKVSPDDKDDDD